MWCIVMVILGREAAEANSAVAAGMGGWLAASSGCTWLILTFPSISSVTENCRPGPTALLRVTQKARHRRKGDKLRLVEKQSVEVDFK